MLNTVTVKNVPLEGRIKVVPSKSETHRALIFQHLGGGSVINPLDCDDTRATARCLEAMSAHELMDAGDSATTLRLLLPLVSLCGGGVFKCGETLRRRPLGAYRDMQLAHRRADGTVEVMPGFPPEHICVSEDLSSQFLSGMLIALSMCEKDTEIHLQKQPVSCSYTDMTVSMMERYGVYANRDGRSVYVKGMQQYKPADYTVGGDWSYGAFFHAANSMGGKVEIDGLDPESVQGDKTIVQLLNRDIADITNTPDLLPVLMIAACAKKGVTVIRGISRLRYKESDRPYAMTCELIRMGARIILDEDQLQIEGTGRLTGGTAYAHDDHRIAMALCIAASICDSPVEIRGANAVTKSAPGFFEHIQALGGIC